MKACLNRAGMDSWTPSTTPVQGVMQVVTFQVCCTPPQVYSQGLEAAQERQWPQWVEWMLDERVTWADRLAERLKRRALDAWEDHQLAAFWATNPQKRKPQRLRVEVGTVHDSHGSIPDHCAAALHLPKVGPVSPDSPHSRRPGFPGLIT